MESTEQEGLTLTASAGFAAWLDAERVSLAFATPPSKLFFVGLRPDGDLGVYERTFDKAMGLAADGSRRLWLGTRTELWRLDDVPLTDEAVADGFDRCFVPRRSWVTGYLNTHDVQAGPSGDVLFVATRFGCIARPSEERSFEPVWQPPFLDRFGPGDRCHLNGLALDDDGTPLFATSVSATGEMESWRRHRNGGGVVTHIPSGEIVASGLSMPHSPRRHGDDLYVTSSGTGQLCHVDVATGKVTDVAFAPGFLRGLSFAGRYAVVGSSRPREGDLYSGLPLDDRLLASGLRPRLGVFVIDLDQGEPVEWLFVEGPMRELFDVVVLPEVRRPMALGLLGDGPSAVFYDGDALVRTTDGRWRAR